MWYRLVVPKKGYHHGHLREALITAATELIERDGIEGFTLAKASRTVGVTHAAAYKHFADRAALLRAVSDGAMQLFGEALRASFDAHPTAEHQYLASGRAVVAFAVTHPQLYQLAFGSLRRDDLATLQAPPEGSALATFVSMIEAWQAAAWLRPGPAHTWALVLWTSAHGLALLVASGRLDVSLEDAYALSDEVLMHVHQGLG